MEMLNEMTVFAQVVVSGGFSAAARHLGISTPAVSRHVTRLEAHLGGRLLQRSTRSLSLTELGHEVHTACSSILETAREVHALAGRYKSQPMGVLRISAPVVIGQCWLAPRLPGFLAAHPQVDVHLSLIDRRVDLAEDGIDVAIRVARDLAPGLAARPLRQLNYVMVASADYLAQHGTPLSPDDLGAHDCAYLGYGRFGAKLVLVRGEERSSVTLSSRVTINNSGGLVALAVAGGGIVLFPRSLPRPRWPVDVYAGCWKTGSATNRTLARFTRYIPRVATSR